MIINQLISKIETRDIVVPEFQREYVWKKNKTKELFSSLLKGYPVGSLLLWDTQNPPALKGIPERIPGTTCSVLLDGQQRLTSLYMIITGKIPSYYTESEITNDPRGLYYNLETRELKFYNRSLKADERWQSVVACFDADKVRPWEIAQRVYVDLDRLNSVLDHSIDYQEPGTHRVFGKVRSLVEKAGLDMAHQGGQIWNINCGNIRILDTTISRLYTLYTGELDDEGKRRDKFNEDLEINEDRFQKFWSVEILDSIKKIVDAAPDQADLVARFMANFNALQQIRNVEINILAVPPTAGFAAAVDIFDKVNTMGEKLTQAELALTHVTAKWADARREMKSHLDVLSGFGFSFDLRFLTRGLVAVACKKALFENLHSVPREQLEAAWSRIRELSLYLVQVLKSEDIGSSNELNTSNALIPIIAYLNENNLKFRDDFSRRSAIHWLHHALIWGRYSVQVDQNLEEDVGVVTNVNNRANPWPLLLNKILEQRGRLKVGPAELARERSTSRFYNLLYTMLKAGGAKDWSNGLALSSGPDSYYQIHRHHIFPKAFLRRHGIGLSKEDMVSTVDDIANFAFLTGPTNQELSDRPPVEYLPEVAEKYPGALETQLIPMDQELWHVDNFQSFLDRRRHMISVEMNKYLGKFSSEMVEPTDEGSVGDLVHLQESETLEFKETWAFDVQQSLREGRDIKNKSLTLMCIKTVCAFLNSHGGDLLIGVTDDNEIEGLDRDVELMDGSLDKLERSITDRLIASLGASSKSMYTIKMVRINEECICWIHVEQSLMNKTWVKDGENQIFYIRTGNSTRVLSPDSIDNYWSSRL